MNDALSQGAKDRDSGLQSATGKDNRFSPWITYRRTVGVQGRLIIQVQHKLERTSIETNSDP